MTDIEEIINEITFELRKLYLEALGCEPDLEALRAEAQKFVAKHGADRWFKETYGNPF